MTRKRNPNQFTTDEAQTATLLVTEGGTECHKRKYMRLRIEMCDKQALEPASRVFGTKITPIKTKDVRCPPHLFPPDGKGIYKIVKEKEIDKLIQHLNPLLTEEFKRKHRKRKETCR